MEWKRRTPTKLGYYWVRLDETDDKEFILELCGLISLGLYQSGHATDLFNVYKDYEFKGPLKP